MMVGRSIFCCAPDSRVVINGRLTPSLWKTESKIDAQRNFLHFMSSEGGLGTATYPMHDNNHVQLRKICAPRSRFANCSQIGVAIYCH